MLQQYLITTPMSLFQDEFGRRVYSAPVPVETTRMGIGFGLGEFVADEWHEGPPQATGIHSCSGRLKCQLALCSWRKATAVSQAAWWWAVWWS